YDQSRGQLILAEVTLAQTTLARKLGLSRQWVGILLERLQDAGWVEHYAPTLDDGMRGSTVFRIGRQLKRVLMMLGKGRARKTPEKLEDNNRWQFSPSQREKEYQKILEQEQQPPRKETLNKITLLKAWLERGKF